MCALRAIFLDKDGTLVQDVPYNIDVNKIRWEAYAMESLRQLAWADYKLIIVTNQSGIAHGLFNEEDLTEVKSFIERAFKQEGLTLDGFYYCAHHPQAKRREYRCQCDCRKPLDGLVRQAVREHDIDVSRSWFIGDILDDIECGQRSGCRTVLIDNGHETEWKTGIFRNPHVRVNNLKEAAARIIHDQSME